MSQLREKQPLTDRTGTELIAGSFVHFHKTNGTVPPGPYRYEGYRSGAHIFSVAGQEFITSDFTPEHLELLNWKRWRKSEYYLERWVAWK